MAAPSLAQGVGLEEGRTSPRVGRAALKDREIDPCGRRRTEGEGEADRARGRHRDRGKTQRERERAADRERGHRELAAAG